MKAGHLRAFDTEIKKALDDVYQASLTIPQDRYTSDQLRMALVAHNLKALVNSLLVVDSDPNRLIDFKQMALGVLGTIDFLEDALPLVRVPGKKEP